MFQYSTQIMQFINRDSCSQALRTIIFVNWKSLEKQQ